jgi:cell division cycle 14
MTAEEAYEKFSKVKPPFIGYRDASYGPCSYKCTLRSCFRGIEFAIRSRLFDIQTFDMKSYVFYERIENGDMNWIIPNKLLAFSSPNQQSQSPQGVDLLDEDVYTKRLRSYVQKVQHHIGHSA